jgi:hypothetical protein
MNNKESKFKAMLYKNKYEPIFELRSEWIDTIQYKYKDIHEFNLTIPKMLNGELNPCYKLIKPKQQIVVTRRDGITQDRFIVLQRSGYCQKSQSQKTFVCYSFEKSLSLKRFNLLNGGNYQLTQDSLEIAKGMLDMVCEQSGWSLGYVDPLAKSSSEYTKEQATVSFPAFTKANVQYDDVLIDTDVALSTVSNQYGKEPLYLSMVFQGVKVDDFDYYQSYMDFDIPYYLDIKHIKATYHSEANNRFSLEWSITLSDDTIEKSVKTFVNATGKTLVWDRFDVIYTTGNMIYQRVNQYPWFDSIDSDIYKVLEDMQIAYDCVFTYDTMDKKINCYSRETMNGDLLLKGLSLSLDSNCLEVKDSESENIITGIKVTGKDSGSGQVDLSEYNIYGGNTLYDYSYVVSQGLLSDHCVEALDKYKRALELKQDEWEDLKTQSMNMSDVMITYDSEILSLNAKITYSTDLLSAYISAKDSVNQALIKAELDGYTTRLNALIVLRATMQTDYDILTNTMSEYATNNKRENIKDSEGILIFNSEDLEQLDDVEEIESISDDYYTTGYSLYQAYVKILADKVKPTIDFDITSDMIKYMKINNNLIKEGSLYYLDDELKSYLGIEKVRLTQMNYTPKTDKIDNLSYSDREKKVSKLGSMNNAGRKVNAVSNTLNSFKKTLTDAQFSNNFVSKVMEEGLNLATATVNGNGTSNIISIGNGGIIVKDSADNNNQIYIGSSLIAISQTGFRTSSVAIDKSGVIADMLIGKISMSNKLIVEGDNGCFTIQPYTELPLLDQFGMKIYDKVGSTKLEKIFIGTELKDGIRVAVFRITGKNGEVVISEEGLLNEDNWGSWDEADSSHPIEAIFYVGDNVSRIDSCKLRFKCARFRGTTKGTESGGTLSTQSTNDGGYYAQTTYSAGNHRHAMFVAGQGFPGDGNLTKTYFKFGQASGGYSSLYTGIDMVTQDSSFPTELYTAEETGSHSHSVELVSHSHGVSIDTRHSHSQIYGIFEDTIATNVSVTVNSNVISTGLNGDNELEIRDYIQKGWNSVKFSSLTNGRIYYNFFMRSFNLF